MTTHDAPTPAVDALVEAMLQSCGQITLILDQMQRHADEAPDAEPIPTVLKQLLCGVLRDLPERHGADDVATAAQMLAAATEVVGEELLLVDTRPPQRPARRRRR